MWRNIRLFSLLPLLSTNLVLAEFSTSAIKQLPNAILPQQPPHQYQHCFNQNRRVSITNTFNTNNNNNNNNNKMPEKRTPPVISAVEDFEKHLPGFLNDNKTLAILMDFDGTLAPIADNPQKTFMTVDMEVTLNKIAKLQNIFLAVISGRGLKDVQSRVGISGITYGGNHGLEIEIDGTCHDYELPNDVQENYAKLVKELYLKVNKNKAWVEDKKVSLTYHYSETPRDIAEKQKEIAVEIINRYGFRPNQAHDAIEAKPPVNWNKGEAAIYILKHKFGEDWANKTKIIFVGDDTTDEDAMRLLQGKAKTFRISVDPDIETFADYRLSQQSVVKDLLNWIGGVYNA